MAALANIFMSNDATAVVLTPKVFAVTKAAKAKPLPYLYVCAFIVNAGSFVSYLQSSKTRVVSGCGAVITGWLISLRHPCNAGYTVFTPHSTLGKRVAATLLLLATTKIVRRQF
jgi:di/tricarboxylate transporter